MWIALAKMNWGPTEAIRAAGARALGVCNDPRVLGWLSRRLLKANRRSGDGSEPGGLQAALIAALAETRSAEAVGPLIESCCRRGGSAAGFRLSAAHMAALKRIGPERAKGALRDILETQQNELMRQAAVRALLTFPTEVALETLGPRLSDRAIQKAMIDALGKTGTADEGLELALVQILRQHDEYPVTHEVGMILEGAIDLLVRWKAVVALADASEHRHPKVREKARKGLGEIAVATAVPILVRRFMAARVIGDETHQRQARALGTYRWRPANDQQRVFFAIAQGDWDTLTCMGDAALGIVLEIFQERRFAEELETAIFKAMLRAGEHALGSLRLLLECPRLYELNRYPVLGALERLSSFLATAHDLQALPLLQTACQRVRAIEGADSAIQERAEKWLTKAMDEIRTYHNVRVAVPAGDRQAY